VIPVYVIGVIKRKWLRAGTPVRLRCRHDHRVERHVDVSVAHMVHPKLHMRIARSTCALLIIWLQCTFENGNIIPVYSPLVDRLGLGPRLVGRLGFSSTG